MNQLIQAIQITDKNICHNIEQLHHTDRGFLAQNIISQLRNLLEHVNMFIYSKETGDMLTDDYSSIRKAKHYIESQGKFHSLRTFHRCLLQVSSHYTPDAEHAERLMLKYYGHLLKLKILLNKYGINILENLEKFPLNTDFFLQEYYSKISQQIEAVGTSDDIDSERYYIQTIKPFFVNQKPFYEITFIHANDHENKFDRIIGFSALEVLPNFAVKFKISESCIQALDHKIPIKIIQNWIPAIRDCELKHLSAYFSPKRISINKKEHSYYMGILKSHHYHLLDLMLLSNENFNDIIQNAKTGIKNPTISNTLEKCREIIISQQSGCNILRYILYTFNNRIIKQQASDRSCPYLSNLYISYKAIPFEQIPFNTSLVYHNPAFYDVLNAIDGTNRQEEFLAHAVKNNTELNDSIYLPLADASKAFPDQDIIELVQKYNTKLYYKHRPARELIIYKNNLAIFEYESNLHLILQKLQTLASKCSKGYKDSTAKWFKTSDYSTKIDCEEKKKHLLHLFENSNISLIYGAAGTGKSTLINHIAHRFSNYSKLFLANTNPAIDNLKRKVTAANAEFFTIAKFLLKEDVAKYDVIFIDECSTVSNSDMLKIMGKTEAALWVLVGDVYQIDSIMFGNWFRMAKKLMPKDSIIELTKPYRTNNPKLLEFWDEVRNMKKENNILEIMTKEKYTHRFDSSVFSPLSEDEIILCLNYDGLYGINNLNRLLQEANPSSAIKWAGLQYKIGDPILFYNSERFAPFIYNNLKGRIADISETNTMLSFIVDVDKYIERFQAALKGLKVKEHPTQNTTRVVINVNKYKNYDEDNEQDLSTIIPFQVAYAISIHKAQGLEYDSVKLIITNSCYKKITHDIFYTAITRTRNKLKIYWSPEIEQKVLKNIFPKKLDSDCFLLLSKYPDLGRK